MPEGYITSSYVESAGDIPIALPATKLRSGEWLVVTSLKLQVPMKLRFRDLQLHVIDYPAVSGLEYAGPSSRGIAYAAIFQDYSNGDPASLVPQGSSADVVSATGSGVWKRDTNTNPLIIAPQATASFSIVLVNNTANVDLVISLNGQIRLDLGL